MFLAKPDGSPGAMGEAAAGASRTSRRCGHGSSPLASRAAACRLCLRCKLVKCTSAVNSKYKRWYFHWRRPNADGWASSAGAARGAASGVERTVDMRWRESKASPRMWGVGAVPRVLGGHPDVRRGLRVRIGCLCWRARLVGAQLNRQSRVAGRVAVRQPGDRLQLHRRVDRRCAAGVRGGTVQRGASPVRGRGATCLHGSAVSWHGSAWMRWFWRCRTRTASGS